MQKERKIYSSFEEIDLDLKILKLEREIHLEKAKMGARRAKESLQPMNLVKGFVGESTELGFGIMQQIVQFILQFVLKYFER